MFPGFFHVQKKEFPLFFPYQVSFLSQNINAFLHSDSAVAFHFLGHTFATAALQNGIDVKTVSSMLGHYDAGFTLRTYTHATRQKQEQAAEKMGNFMDKVM